MSRATDHDGNEIFLVCKPCAEAKEIDFGVRIASRPWRGFYEHEAPTKTLDAWLWQHRNCSKEPDHFKLGYRHQQNSDGVKTKEQSAIEQSIRLASIN